MKYEKFLRNLKPALPVFNSICNTLNLSEQVRRNALSVYKQLIIKGLTKGRKRNVLISACIYLTCKEMNYPISLNGLCKACESNRTAMIKTLKKIKKCVKTEGAVITPEEYVNKYCYELGLSETEKTKTLKKLKEISEKLINKSSSAVAAVTVYTANKEKVSIRRIEKLTGVSRTQITNCLKIIRQCF